MKKLIFALSLILSLNLSFANSEPPVVTSVDLARYQGLWYEIASIPQNFQRGCVGSRANYRLNTDGTVHVINKCWIGSAQGNIAQVEGTASVVDSATNAKLKVDFGFGPPGDYWILNLSANYEYALVGSPSYDALWILSRTPSLEITTFTSIVSQATALGYDASQLKMTEQPEELYGL